MAKRQRKGLVLYSPDGSPIQTQAPAIQEAKREELTTLMLVERLVTDPAVDVGKFERIVELHERAIARAAKARFDESFLALQRDLPVIVKRGKRVIKGQLQSRYARLGEDVQAAVMPILWRHGFTLRHATDWPPEHKSCVRVTAKLSAFGHTETCEFVATLDASDYRSDPQSWGSTISYGERYTTNLILGLIQKGVDDDGERGHRPPQPDEQPPSSAPSTPSASTGRRTMQGTPAPVSPAQASRFYAIANTVGRKRSEVDTWLQARYGVAGAEGLTRNVYDAACDAVAHPGPLKVEEGR